MKVEKLSAKEKAAITRDLFERYRRGETSLVENEVIESLESAFIPEKEFEITDELIDELDAETTDFIFKKIEKPKRRTLSPVLIGSVARIALLIIGFFVLYKPNSSPLITTEQEYLTTDTIKNITLSDGSEIILNSGTTLRENSREVWLDEGEAFFDVKPDKKPFIVYLRNGLKIQVLGTSFAVQSYSELPFQEISVVSGKVNVSTQSNQKVELETNEKAVYRNAKLSKQTTNAEQKVSWRTGTVVLENATAEELRLRIRQLYHKNIVFENQPETMSINITFDKTTPINEIVGEIAALYNFTYQVADDKIVFQSQDVAELP